MAGLLPPSLEVVCEEELRVRGIKNRANTCFLNAVLQSLCTLQSFHIYLLDKPVGQLTGALRLLLQKLVIIDSQYPLDSSYLLSIPELARQFRLGEQNDAHEFLISLLSHIDAEQLQKPGPLGPFLSFPFANRDQQRRTAEGLPLSSSSDSLPQPSALAKLCDRFAPPSASTSFHPLLLPSWRAQLSPPTPSNPFRGSLVSHKTCFTCGFQEKREPTDYFQLSLSLPPEKYQTICTLADCLRYFTQPERHTLDCLNCGQPQPCRRREVIDEVPAVFSVHIKRLLASAATQGQLCRITKHVVFPLHFLRSELLPGSRPAESHSAPPKPAPRRIYSSPALSTLFGGAGPIPHLYMTSESTLPPASVELATLPLESPPATPPPPPEAGQEDDLYILTAVIVHHPATFLAGGHFTTYRRLLTGTRALFQWFPMPTKFKDTISRRKYEALLHESYAFSFFQPSGTWVQISDEDYRFVDEATVLAAEAYMLFYEKFPRTPPHS